MRRCFVLVLMTAFLIPQLLQAEKSFWNSKNAYLGQTPPRDIPRPFFPGLVKDPGAFMMGRVAFSHDGKEFYFAQNDSWESGAHAQLKMVRFEPDGWSKPVVLAEQMLSPTFSMDDKTLYMRKGGMTNLWAEHRQGSESRDLWSAPSQIYDNGIGVYDYMPTLSGNAYVGSEPSEEDKKNGVTYAFSVLKSDGNGKPSVTSLGEPVNEPGFNGDLYVAPDESYMIVSAKETKTLESELWVTFHKKDGSWTAPVSLGPNINDGPAHRWGQYVTPDGKYLFYSHGTSEKDCTVYWVRWDTLLATLRPKDL